MPSRGLAREIGPCRRVVGDFPCADGAGRRILQQHVRYAIAIEVADAGDMPSRRLAREIGPCRGVVGDLPDADGARRRVLEEHVRYAVAVEIAIAGDAPSGGLGREPDPRRRVIRYLPRADLPGGRVLQQHIRGSVAIEIHDGRFSGYVTQRLQFLDVGLRNILRDARAGVAKRVAADGASPVREIASAFAHLGEIGHAAIQREIRVGVAGRGIDNARRTVAEQRERRLGERAIRAARASHHLRDFMLQRANRAVLSSDRRARRTVVPVKGGTQRHRAIRAGVTLNAQRLAFRRVHVQRPASAERIGCRNDLTREGGDAGCVGFHRRGDGGIGFATEIGRLRLGKPAGYCCEIEGDVQRDVVGEHPVEKITGRLHRGREAGREAGLICIGYVDVHRGTLKTLRASYHCLPMDNLFREVRLTRDLSKPWPWRLTDAVARWKRSGLDVGFSPDATIWIGGPRLPFHLMITRTLASSRRVSRSSPNRPRSSRRRPPQRRRADRKGRWIENIPRQRRKRRRQADAR